MVFRRPGPPTAPTLPPPPPTSASSAFPHRTGPERLAGDDLPRLLVLERFDPGFAFLDERNRMVSAKGDPVPLRPALAAPQALGTEHTTDAHFVCYGVRNRTGELEAEIPRLTKGCLPLLVESGTVTATTDVVGVALALDYDLPQHAKWTPSLLAQAQDTFAAVGARNPLFAAPSCWYTTAGGCRFVWLLTDPVPVEGAGGLEDLLGGLVAAAHIAGLPGDPQCRDWTRLFRLPLVTRADKPPGEAQTRNQSYLRVSWGEIDARTIGGSPAPQTLLAYPPSMFRPLSAYTEGEFATDSARSLGDLWKRRIGKVPVSYDYRQVPEAIGPQPTDAQVAALREDPSGGESAQARSAKRYIEASAYPRSSKRKGYAPAIEAHDYLTGKKSLYADAMKLEGLHSGILSFTRVLCMALRERLGDQPGQFGPDFIYAVTIDAARRANLQREPQQRRDDHTLSTEVWSVVGYIYRQFRFQLYLQQQEEDEENAAQRLMAEHLRLFGDAVQTQAKAQMREWAIDSLPGERERISTMEPEQAQTNVSASGMLLAGGAGDGSALSTIEHYINENWQKLLILDVGDRGRSVLTFSKVGRVSYSEPAKNDGTFYAAVRDCGHTLIRDEDPPAAPGGQPRLRAVTHIVREFGTAANLSYSRLKGAPRLRLTQRETGEVAVELVSKAYGIRSDITPLYDPLVDEWLTLLGGSMDEKLMDWLAIFPQLDKKIAGLYIEGAPDIGKGMLGLALKNMTESNKFAPFNQTIEGFQDTMVWTPFVWGDEDTTSANVNTKSVMNTYKKLVTGEFQSLNPKGKTPVEVEGFWRVLLTANSDKLLRWDEDVNENDLGALVQRTLHILVDAAPIRTFLKRIGGSEGTKGWPERNIPQHIMWLSQNRVVKPGQRLYVEGVRTDFHEGLTVNTGGTDIVVGALGRVLAEPDKYPETVLVDRASRRVYINAPSLREVMTVLFADKQMRIPAQRSILQSLKHLSTDGKQSFRQVGRQKTVHRVWSLNVTQLLRALDRQGEQVDLRRGLGPLWDDFAPQYIRDAITNAEGKAPPAATQAPDAPPPPPPPIPFPNASARPSGPHRFAPR